MFCTAGQEKLASTSEQAVIPRHMGKDFESFRLCELHFFLFVSQYFVVRAPSSRELIVVVGASTRLSSVPESFQIFGNYGIPGQLAQK
jgi:hypothetical protein